MIAADGMTVAGLVDAGVGDADDGHDAVVFPDRRMTRYQLRSESIRYARVLVGLGVGPGDHVGILMRDNAEIVVLILAAARLGAVCVPVNARFKSAEIGFVIADSDMRVLLVAPEFVALVDAALPTRVAGRPGRLHLREAPMLRRVVVLGDESLWQEAVAAGDEVPAPTVDESGGGVDVDDPFIILYTSGTTSRPRGCIHTHRGFVHQGVALATRLRLTSADRFWTPLPFFHVGGFDVLLASLAAQCPMVHVGTFTPGGALDQLDSEGITVAFPAFETIWLPVLGHPDFTAERLPHLRLVINVATPERMRLMEQAIPQAVQISCTGSTESAGFCCVGNPDDAPEERAAWAGVPVEGMQARIVDPDTRAEVPDGTPGEMQFRGVARFDSYYRDPQLTAARIDDEGWYSTGDQLVRDEAGRFRFIGRLGDMLKVGGENVAPADVENHLATHPAVHMVQVVGAPDARYVEVPAAFVERVPGRDVTGEELVDFCLGSIATYKVPRYVVFVDDWPMSGTKIQKFRLRELIAARLAEQGITEAPRLTSAGR